MIGRLQTFALDSPDPVALAGFYAGLLGGRIEDDGEGWVDLIGDHGTALAFQRVDDYRAPQWPDPDHPQQAHLDIAVPDIAAAHPEVLALGATPPADWDGKQSWRVHADPAGHPFCLCVQ